MKIVQRSVGEPSNPWTLIAWFFDDLRRLALLLIVVGVLVVILRLTGGADVLAVLLGK